MLSIIAFFVVGFCGVVFVTIWFRTANKELSAARNSLLALDRKIRLDTYFFLLGT